MAASLVPPLPLEILQHILDFQRGHKPTLSSCLFTSKTFRACALRHTYEKISVTLMHQPDRLATLVDCIMVESDLGGVGPFIKSISITVTPMPRYGYLDLDEELVLPLLQAFMGLKSLRHLYIEGHPKNCSVVAWSILPPRTRNALQSVIHNPGLESLSVCNVSGLPPHFFAENTRLLEISVRQCPAWHLAPDFFESITTEDKRRLVNLRKLDLHRSFFSRNHSLPSLQSITACIHCYTEGVVTWEIIKHARNTLESITVQDISGSSRDVPNIPHGLMLNMFPKLNTFSYTFDGKFEYDQDFSEPLLSRVLPFLRVPQAVPNFKTLDLSISLDGYFAFDDLYWTERAAVVAKNRSWSDLDETLTNGSLPGLTSVNISLAFKLLRLDHLTRVMNLPMTRGADKVALKNEVMGILMNTFAKTLSSSVSLQLTVSADF